MHEMGAILAVVTLGRRPEWPDSTDPFKRELGKLVPLCWESPPESRPIMHHLKQDITAMLHSLSLVYNGEGLAAE